MACGPKGAKCDVTLTVTTGNGRPVDVKGSESLLLLSLCRRCAEVSYLPPGWSRAPFYQGIFGIKKVENLSDPFQK